MKLGSDRNTLIDWSRRVMDALEKRGDGAAIDQAKEAISRLESDRFVLTILGKAKRGKSTLLNALLGRRDDLVAPIDKLPASSAITRFRWGPKDQAVVTFRDRPNESIPFERIREFVTEEHNKENRKGVDVVEVSGPFPGLDRDLELVDTPGAGSIHEHHDALLHAFIPKDDPPGKPRSPTPQRRCPRLPMKASSWTTM